MGDEPRGRPVLSPSPLPLVLLAALVVGAPGCSTVADVVAGVFGPGEVGGEVDAHVVYRLRPDCPTLLARSISHGYTVLTPLGRPNVEAVPELPGELIEETGVFEGPVRTGEVIFRYVPPAASDTWASGPSDVLAQVDAVRLDLEGGSARLVELCGPVPEPAVPDPDIPRIPPVQTP